MIIRIVKMTFLPGKNLDFLRVFEENKSKIASYPGCSYLELIQDIHDENTFLTLSHWDKEESLLAYRNSELFNKVWEVTSAMFASKAEAWSTEKVDTGN